MIGSLRDDFTDMIKKEVTLLKTELSEKFGAVGKKSGMVAAGGMIALIGAMFILIGLCFLISMGLQKAGLAPQMANWIAFLGFGLIVAGAVSAEKKTYGKTAKVGAVWAVGRESVIEVIGIPTGFLLARLLSTGLITASP